MPAKVRYVPLHRWKNTIYCAPGDQLRLSIKYSVKVLSGSPSIHYENDNLIIDCHELTKIQIQN